MPTCPRCDHDHFLHLRLLSEEGADTVRREVQCARCSFTGILVADAAEDAAEDEPTGEWE